MATTRRSASCDPGLFNYCSYETVTGSRKRRVPRSSASRRSRSTTRSEHYAIPAFVRHPREYSRSLRASHPATRVPRRRPVNAIATEYLRPRPAPHFTRYPLHGRGVYNPTMGRGRGGYSTPFYDPLARQRYHRYVSRRHRRGRGMGNARPYITPSY